MVFLRGECEIVSERCGSLHFPTHRLKKRSLLGTWQELEKAERGLQKNTRIAIFEIRSGQKVGADHFQAIAAGLIGPQH
jgi:hypothetical protein